MISSYTQNAKIKRSLARGGRLYEMRIELTAGLFWEEVCLIPKHFEPNFKLVRSFTIVKFRYLKFLI